MKALRTEGVKRGTTRCTDAEEYVRVRNRTLRHSEGHGDHIFERGDFVLMVGGVGIISNKAGSAWIGDFLRC